MTTASMNAVTHGLFSHEVVLTTQGEAPEEYAQFRNELTHDLRSQNVLERHCVETIAAALWRLRRFHRWESAHAPDPTLSPDEQFQKMERAQRAEAGLHRRINTALRQLGRDLPDLLQTRAHLALPDATQTQAVSCETQNCQNEPPLSPHCEAAPDTATSLSPVPKGERCPMRADRGPSVSAIDSQNCQNEPNHSSEPAASSRSVSLDHLATKAPLPFRGGEDGGLPAAGEGLPASRRAQLTLLRARRKAAKGLHRV